jgi:hypothetical protein
MALLCVLEARTPEGIGDEFPILVDGNLRATIISEELVKLASKIDEDSIPDIVEDWLPWMDTHGDKVVGANRTPAVQKWLRADHKKMKELLKPKSKKEKAEWDKAARENLQELLHTIKDFSKKAIRRKKALFLRECP